MGASSEPAVGPDGGAARIFYSRSRSTQPSEGGSPRRCRVSAHRRGLWVDANARVSGHLAARHERWARSINSGNLGSPRPTPARRRACRAGRRRVSRRSEEDTAEIKDGPRDTTRTIRPAPAPLFVAIGIGRRRICRPAPSAERRREQMTVEATEVCKKNRRSTQRSGVDGTQVELTAGTAVARGRQQGRRTLHHWRAHYWGSSGSFAPSHPGRGFLDAKGKTCRARPMQLKHCAPRDGNPSPERRVEGIAGWPLKARP